VSSRAVAGDPAHNDGSFTRRKITAEVFFPAKPGSEKGAEKYWYSHSHQNLPSSDQPKVPACPASDPMPTSHKCCEPKQEFDHVYKNLDLDTEHGPYPVIVFIHGTGAWRSYMLHLAELWASRGFVVFAADYPGITSFDMLQKRGKTDQEGDTKLIIGELEKLTHPSLTFLKGHIDMTRVGITGHSAGGFATGQLSSTNGQVLIPIAGAGTHARGNKYSTLVIGGKADSVVYGCQGLGYASSPEPKRHLCVAGAGHETYTDLCWMAPNQGGITGIGRSCGVTGSRQFEPLCDQGCRFSIPPAPQMNLPEDVWPLVRYATAGTFEETLRCDKRMTQALKDLPSKFGKSVLDTWREAGTPAIENVTLV